VEIANVFADVSRRGGSRVMFWKKSNGEKVIPPKDVPAPVGQYLVVTLRKNPDWVWSLRVALKNRSEDKDLFDVRVFDPSQAALRKIAVKGYDTLTENPDLILFEGWFHKKRHEAKVEERTPGINKAA
jgi:hypothetical protein